MRRILATIALVALLSGCDARPEQVRLGVAVARNVRPAIRLAVESINAEGGIRGVPLEVEGLDWTDPGFVEPDATLDWAEFLAGRADVMGVVGHSDSSAALAAAGVYNRRGLPHVVTIATHPGITRVGPWTFRICLDDEQQGRLLARHVVRDWDKRRIAVFYVNDDYGRGLVEPFQKEAEALGGEIVDLLFHRDRPDEDELSVIRRVMATWNPAPEVLVLLGRVPAARALLALNHELGLDLPVLGADATARLLTSPGHERLIDGVRFSSFAPPRPVDESSIQVVRRLTEELGRPPSYDALFTYDGIRLLASAIERSGFDRRRVRATLEAMSDDAETLSGVGGTYALGPDRSAIRPLYVVESREGETRLVGTYRPDAVTSR